MRSRSSKSSFSSSRETALAGLILALLVWLFLFPVLTGGRVWLPTRLLFHVYPYRALSTETPPPWNPLMWDGAAQFGVWRLYTAKMWREGWLPLWNPHQGMGYPLYANSQSAIFYPPNALFAWLQEQAFGWLAGWHLWWAGMGTWLLMRRQAGMGFASALVGAIAFTFSLWMVTWQYLPSVPATASWLPWVVLTAARWAAQPTLRRATWWGATMGFCLLAGHLQIAFYVLGAGVLVVVCLAFLCRGNLSPNPSPTGRGKQGVLPSLVGKGGKGAGLTTDNLSPVSPPARRGVIAASFVFAFVLALALSAPQVLPAVEMSRFSHRRAPATAEGYSAYVGSAMPLAHLVTLFLPDFFGHPGVARTDAPDVSTYWGKGNAAEFACFVGVPALLLAALGLFSRRSAWRLYALLLAVLAMLLALGTPLNALLYFGVPGFSGTGSPARVLVLWAFGVALLAGAGMDGLTVASRKQWLSATGVLLALFVTGTLSARALSAEALGEEAFAELFSSQAPLLLQGLALSALAVGAVLFGQKRGWSSLFTHTVPVACVLGSLWMAGMGYNPPASAQSIYPNTPLVERLQSLTDGKWRIFAVQKGWSLYRAPLAILPPNLATAAGLYDLQIYDSLMPLHAKRWLDGLNGRDSAPVENGNMALGWRAPADLLADMGVRYVLSLQPLAEHGLRLILDSPEGKLYEVSGSRSWVRAADGRECAFRWQGCNRLQVSLPDGARELHVMQTFYPGWKAEPSGTIEPLDGVFQRVQVADGVQEITLRFAPELLKVCLYLALVATGWLAGCACFTGRRLRAENRNME
ncbi:hypothetical protein HRbin16_03102 [bacterium HR16]|nr:hypothetical protein HRbin16_03102 [bacterium HR16]